MKKTLLHPFAIQAIPSAAMSRNQKMFAVIFYGTVGLAVLLMLIAILIGNADDLPSGF